MTNKKLLYNISVFMKAMRLSRYTFERPGAEESLEVIREGYDIKATVAEWLESPHNGDISNYKTHEVRTSEARDADTRLLECGVHDLRANYLRGMRDKQDQEWLKEIGYVE